MKKQWMFFVAAVTALSITACGSGDGIVINGTTAAEAGSDNRESAGSDSQGTGAGTKIEIITEETSPVAETSALSSEPYSQEQTPEPQTTAYVPETAAATVSTTAAPTQAASTAAETTAARTYKVTDVKKTMYATASVRVRSSYSTSSDVLAGLAEGEKVEVTGESENGWMRVNYKGHVGYVSKSYLTETVPQTAAQTASTGQTNSGTGTGNTSSTGNTTSSGNTQSSTPGTGTTGGKNGGPSGPSASNSGNSTSGGKTGPTANNNSGGTTPAGSTTGPGGNSGSGTTPGNTPGGSSQTSGGTSSGSNSVTGSVTSLNPSGVTVQTSDGSSYQFIWGDNTPDLEPGEKIQIFYETTGSGERRVTNYSK